jgi:hypothetical protein
MSLAQVNGPKQGKDKVLSDSWATLLRGLGHWRHCFIRIRNSRATAPWRFTPYQGNEAATKFQKILDHRGLVWNSPFSALAHLQLARAFAIQGNALKARAAYQDFLTLWRDADPDIPIFKQAKLEYAKLE